jgi:aminoglycoside phosphotransferase family enzyme/predicted kinase
MNYSTETQELLIEGLLDPHAYPHPVDGIRRLETHISHILLAGGFAYKIKKPLNLGFLDYSQLARRLHFCLEELRLNSRTAPEIYLDVVGVGGSLEAPRIVSLDTPGSMEYAVRMRRFPEGALLSERLQGGLWDSALVDTLAEEIAAFHQAAAVARRESSWGTPEQVIRPVRDNFKVLASRRQGAAGLQRVVDWAGETSQRLFDTFTQRREMERVRECHGDLHLGNIVMWEGSPCLFDGIEFNEGLRWIDVINDIAFLMMDLEERQRSQDAWRLINRYLEFTGDYAGMAVLDYYRAYRATVRAKVAAIRLGQDDLRADEREDTEKELQAYLSLAESYTRPPRPCLLLTSGLSGSGKTWVSQLLLQTMGMIRLRSDVERKRLFGLGPLEDSRSAVDAGIYTEEATRHTYENLRERAATVLETGHPVIVDATFLSRTRRAEFLELAEQAGVPALVIRCEADNATLRRRISGRQAAGEDASEAGLAVLERQLDRWEEPDEYERRLTLTLDTRSTPDTEALAGQVRERLGI